MYSISTPEVIIMRRVYENPAATRRMERMMRSISADRVIEADDAGLSEIIAERRWREGPWRTGQFRMTRQPTIIFGTFRWLERDEFRRLEEAHPLLRGNLFLGAGSWGFRDSARFRREQSCVCQSAWEFHCALGCLHACDYCHIQRHFTIMLNLEDLAAHMRSFGDTIPDQNLYKFDNGTDTITLEPEYGASEIMVRMFADWPGRYLLLYTKSDNVDHLLKLEHKGHTLVSWSLNGETATRKVEKNTPSLDERIRAMVKCQKAGYPVRARISPMIPVKGWREEYSDLAERLLSRVRPEVLSVDVVGWMQPDEMLDALDTSLFAEPYAAEAARLARDRVRTNGKHLFPHELRADMLRHVITEIKRIRPEQPVSLCMETTAMWQELGPLTGMTPEDYVCCCGPTSVPGHPMLALAYRMT